MINRGVYVNQSEKVCEIRYADAKELSSCFLKMMHFHINLNELGTHF